MRAHSDSNIIVGILRKANWNGSTNIQSFPEYRRLPVVCSLLLGHHAHDMGMQNLFSRQSSNFS